jgi:hypothetical protein
MSEPTAEQLAEAIAVVAECNYGVIVIMSQMVAKMSPKGKWALVLGEYDTFKRELDKVKR